MHSRVKFLREKKTGNLRIRREISCLYSGTSLYNEVGYNKILLEQGNFAGPSSLYFFVFLTLI